LIDEQSVDVVFPVTEQAHIAILTHRERFDRECLPCPDADVFMRVADKEAVLAAAKAVGIATPNQIRLETPAAASRGLPDTLPFPVVIKPARSVVGGAKHVVRYAADNHSLKSQLESLPPEAFPVLVQQRVVGPGVGIFLLIWNCNTLAVFSHRRIRENPPSGGGSVYCESTVADERLVKQAKGLLEYFGWRGLAMVEFKIDRTTDTPYLMEINGRVWGSLQLAIDAGVDFPALLVAAACGSMPEPTTHYRAGVRLRSWWADVVHLLAGIRH
jgi:predicted ATP-grasp superfamily ATP-dependent carboligase